MEDLRENKETITYDYMGGRPSLEAKIYNKVDIMKANDSIKIHKSNIDVRFASGSQIQIEGKATLEITIGKKNRMVEFQIVEGVIPKLIGGMNFLNTLDICLKENEKKIYLFERNEDRGSRYPITIVKIRHGVYET